jgi:hypothetical protein
MDSGMFRLLPYTFSGQVTRILVQQECNLIVDFFGYCWQPGVTMDMDSLRRPHPFIVLFVQQMIDDVGSSFKLVCDGLVCECCSTVIKTFDFLFKFCWVFQLQ